MGTVGAFRVYGLIDFLLVRWDGGSPRLTLVECKASRRDRTYHRVQVAVYRMLLRGLLGGEPVAVGGGRVPPDAVECVVARLDPDRNATQSILALPPLDLGHEEADLARLLAPGGRLDAAAVPPARRDRLPDRRRSATAAPTPRTAWPRAPASAGSS